MPHLKKTLFFTQGMHPTQEEYAGAREIGPGVVFRNARKIVPGAPLENCDAVAGAVPPDYAAIYSGSGDGANPRIYVRPNPVRVATGGPDDGRPGTVHDGIAHESGTGSSFAGEPYAERAKQTRRVTQRANQTVYDKDPSVIAEPGGDTEPKYGLNLSVSSVPSMGAWPTTGSPAIANVDAEMAPSAAKEMVAPMAQAFDDAAKRTQEGDDKKAELAAEAAARQAQPAPAGAWPSTTDTTTATGADTTVDTSGDTTSKKGKSNK